VVNQAACKTVTDYNYYYYGGTGAKICALTTGTRTNLAQTQGGRSLLCCKPN
jgi:hypothetical protein